MKKWGWVVTTYPTFGMKLWGEGVFILAGWNETVGVGMKGMKGMN